MFWNYSFLFWFLLSRKHGFFRVLVFVASCCLTILVLSFLSNYPNSICEAGPISHNLSSSVSSDSGPFFQLITTPCIFPGYYRFPRNSGFEVLIFKLSEIFFISISLLSAWLFWSPLLYVFCLGIHDVLVTIFS